MILKRILIVFVPFLALAFSPIDFRYCKGMMDDCEGCPKMGQENALSPQVSSQEPCCGIYHWEGFNSSNPLLQKSDDSLKGKPTLSLQGNALFDLAPLTSLSFERKYSSLHSYIPPPAFIVKQSFLI